MPEQIQEWPSDKFDLRTHLFNSRGKIHETNHYRLHIKDGAHLYERPVNSGNLWLENAEPAGRIEYKRDARGKIIGKTITKDAPHITYVAPIVGEAKVHFENEDLRAQNARLRTELEAIQAERTSREDAKKPSPKNNQEK